MLFKRSSANSSNSRLQMSANSVANSGVGSRPGKRPLHLAAPIHPKSQKKASCVRRKLRLSRPSCFTLLMIFRSVMTTQAIAKSFRDLKDWSADYPQSHRTNYGRRSARRPPRRRQTSSEDSIGWQPNSSIAGRNAPTMAAPHRAGHSPKAEAIG